MWKPMKVSQKCSLPSRSSRYPAGHLREPEVDAGVDGEHDRAEQHVVEVRHHEVGVGDVEVQRRAGQQHAGQAAEQEGDQEADANSIGVSKVIWPRHIVPIQLKNLIPVGTAIRNVRKLKNGSSTAPVANMWCAHTVIDSAAMASVAAPCPCSRTAACG